jgi:hypothetical protein
LNVELVRPVSNIFFVQFFEFDHGNFLGCRY